MAIRKFRSKIKPFVIVITIAFALSSLIAAYYTMSSQLSMKNYAFKVNGEKVNITDVARAQNMISMNLQNRGDEKIVTSLAVNQVIEDELIQQMADGLKIKVSSKDIDNEYKAVENSVKDTEQFKRMLQAQGFTKASFKKEIEKSLKRIKVFETFTENAKVSDEEIAKIYDNNKYIMFAGESFDKVKDSIATSLKQAEGSKEFYKELQGMKSKMEITDVRDQFAGMEEKVQVVKDGVEFTNVDYGKVYLKFLANGVPQENIDIQVNNYLDTQAKILKEASEFGVEVDNTLPALVRVEDAYGKMLDKAREQVTYTEADLTKFFKDNKSNYDIYPSADSYIAVLKVEPSQLDKDAARQKAEEIKKGLTVNNFAETAKKVSDDPGAANGGDLGLFSQGDMVPEFDKAVFSGKVGEIYPDVVETQFGYHIIYISERNDEAKTAKASHILVRNRLSETTLNEALKEAQEMASKISNDEIKFSDLPKDKYFGGNLFEKITDTGYIPGIGFNEELSKEIYKAPLQKVEVKKVGETIYIFQKVRENKYKSAEFSEVKDRVKEEYIYQKALETMRMMAK